MKTIWKVIDSHTDNKLVLAGPIGGPVSLQQVVVPGFRIGRVARQRALSGSIELATGLARLMPSS